jgi:WD40 repeat protein
MDNYLISGGDDFLIIIYDLEMRTVVKVLKEHEDNINDLCYLNKL